jgi:hypothetical protein
VTPIASSARKNQWQAILNMTESMHILAEQEEWQALVAAESERQRLIQSFFATPVSAGESALIAEGIQAILHSDGELMAKGSRLKQDAADVLMKIAGSRKGINAYQDCR